MDAKREFLRHAVATLAYRGGKALRGDEYLAADLPLGCPPEKLFQGPIADALNHVGHLATLRSLASSLRMGSKGCELAAKL